MPLRSPALYLLDILVRLEQRLSDSNVWGDFRELYFYQHSERTPLMANLWLVRQLLLLAPSYLYNKTIMGSEMLLNYLKISWRTITKQKLYSTISVAGLMVGFASFLFIFLFADDNLRYDESFENKENIYRLLQFSDQGDDVFKLAITFGPLSEVLYDKYPEIVNHTMFTYGPLGKIEIGENDFFEPWMLFAKPTFFDVFSYEFIAGKRDGALDQPGDIVLSDEAALKFFGTTDCVGRELYVEGINSFTVSGVIRKEKHTHHRLDIIVNMENYDEATGYDYHSYDRINYTSYVVLDENAEPKEVEKKIAGELHHIEGEEQTTVYLQPLDDVYLNSDFDYDFVDGPISLVTINQLLSIGVLIVLIGCINFMNINTARISLRMHEAGLRKVLGASRRQVITQFLVESMIISVIAAVGAVVLVQALLSPMNEMLGVNVSLADSRIATVAAAALAVVALSGLAAGFYPALKLARGGNEIVISSSAKLAPKQSPLQKLLIVGQFTASVALIIIAVTIYQQLSYIQERDLGYNKDNLIVVPMRGSLVSSYDSFKNGLEAYPAIKAVTASQHLPNWSGPSYPCESYEGNENASTSFTMHYQDVGLDYLETFGIKLVKGKGFSKKRPGDLEDGIIINQAAVRALGWQEPVGKWIEYYDGAKKRVIGVISDFHYNSLKHPLAPMMILHKPESMRRAIVRYTGEAEEAVAAIEAVWKKLFPAEPFDHLYFEAALEAVYRSEEQVAGLVSVFAMIAIVLSAVGLFGMSSITVESRKKEVGIRKVLGASGVDIAMTLSKSFLRLVVAAVAVSIPVAWYLAEEWLQEFYYRIDQDAVTFIVAALAAFLIASVTVSYQTLRAASLPPADTIRQE